MSASIYWDGGKGDLEKILSELRETEQRREEHLKQQEQRRWEAIKKRKDEIDIQPYVEYKGTVFSLNDVKMISTDYTLKEVQVMIITGDTILFNFETADELTELYNKLCSLLQVRRI